MMRVAALMDTVKVSGPARQLVAIVEPLRELGVHVHVLAFHPAGDARTPFIQLLESNNVPHTAVPAYGRLRWRTLRALDDAFTAVKPMIVQTHSYRPNAHVLLLRLLKKRREPWLAFFHGITAENRLVKLYHRLDRLMLARADAVAVVAESQLVHVGRARGVSVIPNAVLPAGEQSSWASTRVAGDPPTMLYVGRLSYEKGVDVLLNAWPSVLREHPSAQLQIVGEGPERAALESLVAALGVGESVQLLGHHAEPWQFYRTASLVVLPSISEGVPNVLLEAIARDVPVVATNVGGIPHVMGDPPAGLLVGADSSVAIADAILRTLADTADAKLRELRRGVREKHSTRARALALHELYARVLAA